MSRSRRIIAAVVTALALAGGVAGVTAAATGGHVAASAPNTWFRG